MEQRRDIPSYFVYGEPSRPVDVGFFHVETVRARNSVHLGHVAPHQHADFAQVTFWTSGQGVYRIEDTEWHFSAPAVSFVTSRTVHGFDVAEGSDAIVLSISDAQFSALRGLTNLPLDQSIFLHGVSGGEWDLLSQIMALTLAQYRLRPTAEVGLLASLSAATLNYVQALSGSALPHLAPGKAQAIAAFRHLLELHYVQPLTTERYAEMAGMTSQRLEKAVREALGCSVKQAVLDRRLLEAKRLLRFTIRPVEDIGYAIGFEDPSYFSRFFRRMTGLSPTVWRQQN